MAPARSSGGSFATATRSPGASSAASWCAGRGGASASATRCRGTEGRIARADGEPADPADFLPSAYRDLDELEGFLEHLSREVYDPSLKLLLGAVLGDRALRAELRRAPCSVPSPQHSSH